MMKMSLSIPDVLYLLSVASRARKQCATPSTPSTDTSSHVNYKYLSTPTTKDC